MRLYSATVVADGRPLALRSEDTRDTPGALLQAASGSHSGLQSRSDRTTMVTRARATAGGSPDASLLPPAGRVHPVCMAQGTCGLPPAIANRPAEAALCSESRASIWTRVYLSKMPDLERAFCAQSRPTNICDQCRREVGCVRLARASRLAPTISLDFSRSNARGRSDLHSLKDAWTSQQTHDIPEYCKIGMNAAPSPSRQNGVSSLIPTDRSGFCEQIDGIGSPRAIVCIDTQDPRRRAWSAGRDYSARRAKVGFGGEFGGSRKARADGTDVWVWSHRSEQLARTERDWAASGTADAAKWGEPAGELFDAAARNDQHQ